MFGGLYLSFKRDTQLWTLGQQEQECDGAEGRKGRVQEQDIGEHGHMIVPTHPLDTFMRPLKAV